MRTPKLIFFFHNYFYSYQCKIVQVNKCVPETGHINVLRGKKIKQYGSERPNLSNRVILNPPVNRRVKIKTIRKVTASHTSVIPPN